MVQIFDSWAHHLSPAAFAEFSMTYAEQVVQGVKAQRPDTPLIFHANGGALPCAAEPFPGGQPECSLSGTL